MIDKFQLFFHTVKYLKFGQIYFRIKRKFFKPSISDIHNHSLSKVLNEPQKFIACEPKMISENSFNFLNMVSSIESKGDWNKPSLDKLWLYNLHYFDDLNSVDSNLRNLWHKKIINRWIFENQIGYGNGWEAYPSSLRIVNWIKWALNGNSMEYQWLNSLASQVEYLSKNLEKHLLGNHIFANAKALVFAGLFFQGERPDCWYQTGLKIIIKELNEQVLEDGGNFELSPMYHSIFLEDLLDLVNIHYVYNKTLSIEIENKIRLMINWLRQMCHPDGQISFFNDAAFGIAPTLENLIDYSERLNINIDDKLTNNIEYLENSGYIKLDCENLVSIIDVASIGPDYIPGHGHADALSFELSLFDRRFIVNSGTSIYGKSSKRIKERSTFSHSTVVIDDENSSEIWSGFRVARRAKVFDVSVVNNNNLIYVTASHDGYKRLKGKPIHIREWNYSTNNFTIKDFIKGYGRHKIESIYPLHPDITIMDLKESEVSLKIQEKLVRIEFEGLGVLKVEPSEYHPEFGLSIDNLKLVYSYEGLLPLTNITSIIW